MKGASASPARVAGLCYVAIIGLGVWQSTIVAPLLGVSGDAAGTAALLAEHTLVVRLGILSDVILYTLVLVLSVALYVLLRGVHQPALVLRSAEGVLGLAVTILGGLVPLALLSDRVDPDIVQSFLTLRESGLQVVLMLVGSGGATFCYLFLRSHLVPRGLALWGVLTYLSMLLLGAFRTLQPIAPAQVSTLLYAQGALFEVVFGVWLLVAYGRRPERRKVP